MFDITEEQEARVDLIIRGAVTIRGAIMGVAQYLDRRPEQVAEFVTVARTGRFDITPGPGDPDDNYAGPQHLSEVVEIRQHGELGPVLSDPAHEFTTEAQIS